MILQHTTTINTLLPLVIAPICNAATGRTVHSGMYESKLFNDKKYWPGLYRT
jgi:hypothetical protein